MNITLKQKNLADGRISLFIEYYKGSSTNAQGRRVHLRNFEYLKLYLHSDPKSAKEKKENKETILLIHPSVVKWEYFENVIPLP